MALFSRTKSPAAKHIEQTDTSMVSLVKTAAISLTKAGLDGQRAAVYLVLDHSGSMRPYYRNGDVQRLAEQALGLSANLDDDGTVPLIYFGKHVDQVEDARIGSHQGVIDRTHQRIAWGSTDYAAAIRYVTAEHRASETGRQLPALVIFQTDGEPDSRPAAEQALRDASHLPIFWAFVGFGRNIAFLERLDDLPGRAVDNASFFHAAQPARVTNSQLYDGITREFSAWLAAARSSGITP